MCNLLKPLHRAWRTITLTGNVHVGLSIRSVEDENTANKDRRWCEGTTLMLEKTVEILPAADSSIRCLPLRFLFSKLHARLKNRKEKSMKWMLYLYSFLAFQCPGQEVAGFSSLNCLHSLERPATSWPWRLHWGTFNHVVIFLSSASVLDIRYKVKHDHQTFTHRRFLWWGLMVNNKGYPSQCIVTRTSWCWN